MAAPHEEAGARVRIMPNPMRVAATLRLEAIDPGEHRLTLYDMVGRSVLRRAIRHGTITIERVELLSGSYLYLVKLSNGERLRGILVVE